MTTVNRLLGVSPAFDMINPSYDPAAQMNWKDHIFVIAFCIISIIIFATFTCCRLCETHHLYRVTPQVTVTYLADNENYQGRQRTEIGGQFYHIQFL